MPAVSVVVKTPPPLRSTLPAAQLAVALVDAPLVTVTGVPVTIVTPEMLPAGSLRAGGACRAGRA